MVLATPRLNAHLKVEKMTEVARKDSVYAVHVSTVACQTLNRHRLIKRGYHYNVK